ncbi:hypothetical protein COI41_29900 [Bacillus toyonensis]|uniref:hypothetical protein n=1 Tax=Bacillus toyonensis TaxID=155322 RepID=UPI000BF0A5F1|nr:hypothetical protein [Bacillus toyonensis]PEO57638.1 hypothetical protein CN567_27585 [Bacillus toyonensis]PFX72688.1 hypothetical protein COL37_28725 [Bacillus toyonensis]PFX75220.1 hypothetical protein COL38_29620 [Bacillus toyonensis]PGB00935.1 hypothetical protein COL98_30120 [Bacillus toyonensis]PHF47983.1 hypothetical protein COI41_29900 [Bacillus toyonensis]
MKLTKQEQAVAIGTCIPMLGPGFVNERIDKQKLESAIPIFNELEDDTTQKQKREAMVSLIDKTMDEFLVMNDERI